MGRRREKVQMLREGKGDYHGFVIGVKVESSWWTSAFKGPHTVLPCVPAQVVALSQQMWPMHCSCLSASHALRTVCGRQNFSFQVCSGEETLWPLDFQEGSEKWKGSLEILFSAKESRKDVSELKFCQCQRFLTRKCRTDCSTTDSQQRISIQLYKFLNFRSK